MQIVALAHHCLSSSRTSMRDSIARVTAASESSRALCVGMDSGATVVMAWCVVACLSNQQRNVLGAVWLHLPESLYSYGFPVGARFVARDCAPCRAVFAMPSRVVRGDCPAVLESVHSRASRRVFASSNRSCVDACGRRRARVSAMSLRGGAHELDRHAHARKFFCTFFLTSSCKRIMIRLDKSPTSLQRSRKQD